MVRLLTRAVLVSTLALSASSSACGGAATYPRAPDVRADPAERLLRLRASTRAVARETEPGHAEVELERIEAWTAKAESLFRADGSPEMRDLLIETAEGELSALRARIVLRRARAELDKARAPSPFPSNNPSSESPR